MLSVQISEERRLCKKGEVVIRIVNSKFITPDKRNLKQNCCWLSVCPYIYAVGALSRLGAPDNSWVSLNPSEKQNVWSFGVFWLVPKSGLEIKDIAEWGVAALWEKRF